MLKPKPKSVEWDLLEEGRTVVDDVKYPKPHPRDPINVERLVTASYKGKTVILLIKEVLENGRFLAEVKGFDPPAESFKDLYVGQEVLIEREEIKGI